MKSWRVDLKGKSNFCLLKICKIVTAFTLTSRFFFKCVCACLFMFICKTWPKNQYNTHNDSKFAIKWLLVLRIASGNIYLNLPNNNVAFFVFRIDQISNNLILGKILQERYQIFCIILNELLTQHMVDLGKIFSQSCAINNNI